MASHSDTHLSSFAQRRLIQVVTDAKLIGRGNRKGAGQDGAGGGGGGGGGGWEVSGGAASSKSQQRHDDN